MNRLIHAKVGSNLALSILLASILVQAAAGLSAEQGEAHGLSVNRDGVLLLRGRLYRGIGVNYFNAFYDVLKDSENKAYERNFQVLAERKIPFARFMCGGFWPVDNQLYLKDKAEYFRRLDGVVRAAEKHGVGLIPSLFWHDACVPDMLGEPRGAWGDPGSKTRAFMRTYTRVIVTRYRESPAIWAWEFGNEYLLGADLPNADKHRPKIVPKLGTATTRGPADDLTHGAVRAAYAAFGSEVGKHDPRRVILSGDAIPREHAWHNWKEKSWTKDSPEQYAEMLRRDTPAPLDMISIHVYGDNHLRIAPSVAEARRLKKPLFIGEFGVPGPPTPESRKKFFEMLKTIEESGVPLAALWVFDHRQPEWRVTADNERAYQLEAVAAANQRLRTVK